jgi:uncharacterized protein (TIGR02466 family)
MPVEQWFPTPVYFHIFEDSDLFDIQTEIDQVLPLFETNLKSPWDDSVLSSFDYKQESNFLKYTPILKNKIIEHIVNFINKDVSIKFVLNQSWINVCKKYGYQNYHSHDSDISGVYYYNTNGNDGDIKFKTESKSYQDSKLLSILDIPTSIVYTPCVGKLILFPSFLQHAVLMNNTDNDRISISFNINFEVI